MKNHLSFNITNFQAFCYVTIDTPFNKRYVFTNTFTTNVLSHYYYLHMRSINNNTIRLKTRKKLKNAANF